MIALAVVAAIVVIVSMTKVGILVVWDGELTLRLVVGPFRFSLASEKKEETTSADETEKSSTQIKKNKESKGKSPWPRVLLANWQELLELVGRVLHMPEINPLILKATFGGEDPAESAVNYGRAWALLGLVLPILERNFTIGRRDIDVVYDRDAKQMSVYAKAALTVRVGQGVRLAVSALMLFLRLYRETKQTKKAVQM